MSSPSSTAEELHDPTWRSVISLALVLHLFCVALVLSANVNPSRLQARLATVFAPYTRALHLDPGMSRVEFTDGTILGDDHVLELRPGGTAAEQQPVRWPQGVSPWHPEFKRRAAIAFEIASFAEQDNLAGQYAKSIGGRWLRAQGWEQATLLCRHKNSQPMDLSVLNPRFPADNPNAAAYFDDLYEAQVWIDEDGELNMQKTSKGRDAAPTAKTPTPP